MERGWLRAVFHQLLTNVWLLDFYSLLLLSKLCFVTCTAESSLAVVWERRAACEFTIASATFVELDDKMRLFKQRKKCNFNVNLNQNGNIM